MFDTVNFWIPSNTYEESKVVEKLTNVTEKLLTINDENNFIDNRFISGKLENYRVEIYSYGISLQGSIAKYIYGEDTTKFANRLSYKKGIEKLFGMLNLDLNNASITRVDIGQNLRMKKPVLDYYTVLLGASRLTRLRRLNSLYFENDRKQMIFYDKSKERANKEFGCISQNLLRYELRLRKNPKSFLKLSSLHANDLYEKAIYKQLLNFWYEEYQKVQKASDSKPKLDFSPLKQFKESLLAWVLFDHGVEVYDEIDLQAKSGLISRGVARRCRIAIADIQRKALSESKESSLLKELNAKMTSKYRQCLNGI